MCDERVSTRVQTPAGWRSLQEFLILDHGEAPIDGIQVDGLADARPTTAVLESIAAADVVVIGPSNPVISIGPILSVPGLREAIAAATAPVIAVSPLVAGRSVKGPTEAFMAAIGRPCTAAGVASLYEGVLDAMVVDADDPDPPPEDVTVLKCPALMEGAEGRRELSERVLELAAKLRE
jgi:LPPG:FO 2-phospho-L-lactate transferase